MPVTLRDVRARGGDVHVNLVELHADALVERIVRDREAAGAGAAALQGGEFALAALLEVDDGLFERDHFRVLVRETQQQLFELRLGFLHARLDVLLAGRLVVATPRSGYERRLAAQLGVERAALAHEDVELAARLLEALPLVLQAREVVAPLPR